MSVSSPATRGPSGCFTGTRVSLCPGEGVCSSHSQPLAPLTTPTRGFWKQNVGSWLALRILQNILEGYTTVHRNLFLNEKDKKQKEKAPKLERKKENVLDADVQWAKPGTGSPGTRLLYPWHCGDFR